MNRSLPPMVLLCGGLGIRLRTVVADRPKPLARVFDRPFLDHVISYYHKQGVPRFILCAGYLGHQIFDYYATTDYVKVLIEDSPLGTAGALRRALQLCPLTICLVANGDSIVAIDLLDFTRSALRRNTLASISVAKTADLADGGSVRIDSAWNVLEFIEKAGPDQGPGWLNAGVYFVRSEISSHLPQTGSLERQVFPSLAQDGQISAYPSLSAVLDIGTPERFYHASDALLTLKL